MIRNWRGAMLREILEELAAGGPMPDDVEPEAWGDATAAWIVGALRRLEYDDLLTPQGRRAFMVLSSSLLHPEPVPGDTDRWGVDLEDLVLEELVPL